ncbi:MAG: hypothetical protein QOJ99_1908 [Bryobacterales bacterium]|nr:hypothetical protein [Bryobacterales bacterium]
MDEGSLDELVRRFEDGTWPVAEWKHAHHVMLAASYILDGDNALERLRVGIPRYNVSQGGANTEDSGYHETLTCFWYWLIRGYIGQLPAGLSRPEVVQRVVNEYAPQRDLFRRYYDFDVVKSREARAVWIPPAGGMPGIDLPLPEPAKSTAPE